MARTELGATVVQQSCIHTGEPLFGNLDGLVPGAPRAVVDRLNQAMRDAAAREGVLVLDLAHWAERHGRDAWFDPVRWHYAKQLVAPGAAVFYGDLVGRVLAALRGRSSKCLVLDLDNTLWGGVIGDDGLDGIVLGQGNAAGEAFIAFQSYVKRLSERGVILAVCSKNDPAIAEHAFRQHPEMVLKRDDIAAFVANWQDKPSNLREIARALNIGLDSLVFFDDNPAEREIVRQNLPEVAVPEAPAEVTGFSRCVAEGGWFEAVSFTTDDQQRGQQYLANQQRDAASSSATNMADFLASLEMRMLAAPFNRIDLPRIAQLTGKTNQFNVTTRRYSQEQLAAFGADPKAVALSFRLIDRFGDNGLICVLIALPDPADSATLRIDTWLMSCRVLGRQVEQEVINQLCQVARERGFARLIGEYIPTAKNGLVRELYQRVGFERISPEDATATLWSMAVPDDAPYRTFIDVEARYRLEPAE
jgi:FkbH-like protein